MLTAWNPSFRASIAHARPVGPDPTTTTSKDSLIGNRLPDPMGTPPPSIAIRKTERANNSAFLPVPESSYIRGMTPKQQALWTIGHSTRDSKTFLDLLKENDIGVLVDVRRYPGSRRHPQFG